MSISRLLIVLYVMAPVVAGIGHSMLVQPVGPVAAFSQTTLYSTGTATYTSKTVRVGYWITSTIFLTTTVTTTELLAQQGLDGPYLRIDGHWKTEYESNLRVARVTANLTISNLLDAFVVEGGVWLLVSAPQRPMRTVMFRFGSIGPRENSRLYSALPLWSDIGQADLQQTTINLQYVSVVCKRVLDQIPVTTKIMGSSKGTETFVETYTTTYTKSEVMLLVSYIEICIVLALMGIVIAGAFLIRRLRVSSKQTGRAASSK